MRPSSAKRERWTADKWLGGGPQLGTFIIKDDGSTWLIYACGRNKVKQLWIVDVIRVDKNKVPATKVRKIGWEENCDDRPEGKA